MNTEEVRQAIEDRLAKIMSISKMQKSLLNDVILGKHAQGVIDAIEGTQGEQQFLEKLINEMR